MRGASEESRGNLLRLLASRLERLSVDSIWARRASGMRGSVIKTLELVDGGIPVPDEQLDMLIEQCFQILKAAAREIPEPEEQLKSNPKLK